MLVVLEVCVWRYGAECEKRGQVLQSYISRRVAGIWFIRFLRSVSCVWFDEREKEDRPAYQIDCLRIALPSHSEGPGRSKKVECPSS